MTKINGTDGAQQNTPAAAIPDGAISYTPPPVYKRKARRLFPEKSLRDNNNERPFVTAGKTIICRIEKREV